MRTADRILKPQHIKFLQEYVKTGNASKAAIAAGYNRKGAAKEGARILDKPLAQEYLDTVRKNLVDTGVYDATEAMRECNDAVALAKAKGNPMALVKAIELKSKLSGLLIEKRENKNVGGFQIRIEGIGQGQLPTPIDITPRDHQPLIEMSPKVEDVITKPASARIMEETRKLAEPLASGGKSHSMWDEPLRDPVLEAMALAKNEFLK